MDDQRQTPNGSQEDRSVSDYREGFAPEMKTAMEKFDTTEKLASGYIELEKDSSRLRNEKGLIIPGENATPEEMSAYYNSLGRPETADVYELSEPKDMPDGMVYDAERTKAFAEIAHKEGVTAKQLSALHKAWNDNVREQIEAQNTEVTKFATESTAEIKKEWGADFEANLAQADTAIDKIFGPDFNKMLKDTGLANHPDVVRGMFKASQAIGEHALTIGKPKHEVGEFTMEKLISMKMDPRYSDSGQRDPAYIKEVEMYNRNLSETMGA